MNWSQVTLRKGKSLIFYEFISKEREKGQSKNKAMKGASTAVELNPVNNFSGKIIWNKWENVLQNFSIS